MVLNNGKVPRLDEGNLPIPAPVGFNADAKQAATQLAHGINRPVPNLELLPPPLHTGGAAASRSRWRRPLRISSVPPKAGLEVFGPAHMASQKVLHRAIVMSGFSQSQRPTTVSKILSNKQQDDVLKPSHPCAEDQARHDRRKA